MWINDDQKNVKGKTSTESLFYVFYSKNLRMK